MNDEPLDVVNEHDEVIDCRTRADVHRLGLRHRAVHVLVFDTRGRLFLQKRSMRKDCHPGTWDSSAAGHLDAGEDYDACAVRELHEELGIKPAHPLERLFQITACPATGQEFVWVYRTQAEGPFRLHPDEIECGEWIEPDQLDDWLRRKPAEFASGFVALWKQYRLDFPDTNVSSIP